MENSKPKQVNHAVSAALFCIGVIMAFIGFVYPGWAWILMTPGDTEMVPLAVITAIGTIGLLLIGIAAIKRVRDNRTV